MLGVGGLMGVRVATSVLLGALVNFAVLAPIMIQRGEIRAYTAPSGALVAISRPEIVNQWSLWWGVTMMVVGALVGLAAKPEVFTKAFATLTTKKAPADAATDPLRHIEVPLWVSFVGVPILSIIGAAVTHEFFGVSWFLALISLPLIFLLTVICANSMALTSWTPTGALSKITQFTMGAIDRVNPATNLIPATMTAEIASNASNLLSDIKPGYMLGAKPRQQAVGHFIGILAGTLATRAALLPALSASGARRHPFGHDHRVGAIPHARRHSMEGRGGPDHERLEPTGDIGSDFDGRCGRPCRRVRSGAYSHEGSFPALRGLDWTGCCAAAGVVRRDVGGRDDLLVAGPEEARTRHARPRDLDRGL